MPNGNVPSLNDLMSMMDMAEDSIGKAVEGINETTQKIMKRGNGYSSCESPKPELTEKKLFVRIRRRINGVK